MPVHVATRSIGAPSLGAPTSGVLGSATYLRAQYSIVLAGLATWLPLISS